MYKRLLTIAMLLASVTAVVGNSLPLKIKKGENLVLLGNGLGERMIYFPYFETELQMRFADKNLIVRNICHPGDTPGFRPHPSRETQWAFPGAEAFHPHHQIHTGVGHYPYPDEWLTMLEADTILAFFGFNESFDGIEHADRFYYELDAFIKHTLEQQYNGKSAPRLILVSPIAFEDLSDQMDLPDGVEENKRLAAYTAAMKRAARDNKVGFIDLFTPTTELYASEENPQTINGFSLTNEGYANLAGILADALYGETDSNSFTDEATVYEAVADKNWFWFNDYRMLNGVHVHGRRYKPYGDKNYPEEIEKIREMTALRDVKIHEVVQGKTEDLSVDDSKTRDLTPIETNFDFPIEFKDVDKALEGFTLPEGYKVDLFASESEFPDLRNPVQASFDNKGRLWVSVLPSYPHYKPGDERPNDKILIFEDTDNDGRADKQIVFADGLHLPIGFEIAPEGVYVSQEPNLVLLVDDDGDDKADRQELLLHGFDSHDTHHAISAYSADASGAFYMNEGRFLHSQVETPYGPERCTDGGAWRFDPNTWRLERFMQTDLSNPWGIAFDEWGQTFLSDASPGANWWSLPLSVKIPYGMEIEKVAQFTTHRVRPTSGSEFLYSRHFPDEMQGDFLIANAIGFLGIKQHKMWEDGAGFTGELRHDLIYSNDPNFRPCEIETAPDGSLYLIDWHNPLIGHMQHSARDPNRDNDHGRIYRITYPERPLVEPAEIAGASLDQLFENLKLHEYRSRYRTRREIRSHDADKVLPAISRWASRLKKSDPNYNRHLLEALWVTWGQNQVDEKLLRQCLDADSHELRSAAVRVLRYAYRQIDDYVELFMNAAVDEHPRVRLEAVVASSWMESDIGARIAAEGMKMPITKWMGPSYEAIMWTLGDRIERMALLGELDLKNNENLASYLAGDLEFYDKKKVGSSRSVPQTNVPAHAVESYNLGREVYHRDAHCATCHGNNGKGTIPDIYPPLSVNKWLNGSEDRLIKLVLKGLWGPIEVEGKIYDPKNGVPPMTGFEGILTDEEIAAVITYVKIQYGNPKGLSKVVDPADVARVREEVKAKTGFYMVEEILEIHPHD